MTALYGIWHRPTGLINIANRIKFRAQVLMSEFDRLDIKYLNDPTNHFDTISIDCRASGFSSSDFLISEFHKEGINLRKIDDFTVGISFNETTTI
jgi:glycine dehydrogenase